MWGSGFRTGGSLRPRIPKRRACTRQPRPPQQPVVLNLRTSASQNCKAVSRRARIQGETFVSLNSDLESHEEEEEYPASSTLPWQIPRSTRGSTTFSSKVNLSHANNFIAVSNHKMAPTSRGYSGDRDPRSPPCGSKGAGILCRIIAHGNNGFLRDAIALLGCGQIVVAISAFTVACSMHQIKSTRKATVAFHRRQIALSGCGQY